MSGLPAHIGHVSPGVSVRRCRDAINVLLTAIKNTLLAETYLTLP